MCTFVLFVYIGRIMRIDATACCPMLSPLFIAMAGRFVLAVVMNEGEPSLSLDMLSNTTPAHQPLLIIPLGFLNVVYKSRCSCHTYIQIDRQIDRQVDR